MLAMIISIYGPPFYRKYLQHSGQNQLGEGRSIALIDLSSFGRNVLFFLSHLLPRRSCKFNIGLRINSLRRTVSEFEPSTRNVHLFGYIVCKKVYIFCAGLKFKRKTPLFAYSSF